jgi:molybdopterin-binding protein
VKCNDDTDWDLTGLAVAKVESDFEARAVKDIKLAWGKKVSAELKSKVVMIAAKLGVDPIS